MIFPSGTTASASGEVVTVRSALPEHIRLTRPEPGCLSFEFTETAPGAFAVSECFADRAALEAYQARTRASAWWQTTGHISRNFTLAKA